MNETHFKSWLIASVTLCADKAHAINTTGWSIPSAVPLVPDDTKAYLQFKIGGSWPGRTAYGTALHPGTVANSYTTMLHQVINDRHKMKVHADDNPNARDTDLGAVVALDYPRTPMSGWRMVKANAPMISAAGVLHKQMSRVPEILKEHLGGLHTWTVSQEVYFSRAESGFVVEADGMKKKSACDLLAASTPQEFKDVGLGYVPYMDAPDELVGCYDDGKRQITRDWEGCRVTLLKGGVNGQVHWGGVGLVPYGAEREAEIMDLLASLPNAECGTRNAEQFQDYRNFLSDSKKVVDAVGELCSTDRA